MQTVLISIHLMVVLALVVVVLLQRSEGGGLGIGGGSGGFMTGRGQANLLTRTTAGLAAAFFITSLLLTILANQQSRSGGSLLDQYRPAAPTSQPANPPATPAQPAPAAPAPSNGGSVFDQLQGGGEPAAPAKP
ncbi:preprotein translocase subunit SecG [Labrys sp. KNU-23]|uniref:preprotein translocase subunit SecG n=1 Tax=Labrys sp. KNU-23 TaxID=2789216 RepID=UPI0011ED7808|nr:preprotein translocase subunit SecG [Labrys sp. KNU-23]QEN90844.1 preprotein translocase subunit SecG [Labrys sp. KNU-23]